MRRSMSRVPTVRELKSCGLLQHNRRHTRTLRLVPNHFLPSNPRGELLPCRTRNADRAHGEAKECQRKQLNACSRSIQPRSRCNLEEGSEVSQSGKCRQTENCKASSHGGAEVKEHHCQQPAKQQYWSHHVDAEEQQAVESLPPADVATSQQ